MLNPITPIIHCLYIRFVFEFSSTGILISLRVSGGENNWSILFQVSGEYAMLTHAANAGAFDLQTAVMESLVSMRRAGADVIISYFTPKVMGWLFDR